MDPKWLGARVRRAHPTELPARVRALWTRWRDPHTPPPPTPPGPAPWWPPELLPAPAAELPPPIDLRASWEPARLQGASLSEVEAWLDAHPVAGPGWESALEVAVRLVSLVAHRDARLRPAIHTHAWWIARHPSVGSSARNHRVGELGALALAAAALPDLPEAAAWRAEAERLRGVLRAQLHPDGAGIEQSTHYLGFVLDWARLARACGIADLDEPIARGTRFLSHLDGIVIGDGDDGRILAPSASSPTRASAVFPDGGLTVLRDGPRLAVFDHGPLGEPDLGAHAHADALSCWLSLDGRPILVGRGTGAYLGDPAARRFHRGTLAHPTVVVAGADQSVAHEHPFLWRTRAVARLEAVDLAGGRVTASHDGYLDRFGVLHRRTVRLRDGALVLEDTLEGTGRRHVAVVLPLAPDIGEGDLRVHPDPACTTRVVRGGAWPGPGWHSPAYGRWVEATTLLLEARPELPVTLRTTLTLA